MRFALVALLLLGACGSGGSADQSRSASEIERECRREARRSPQMTTVLREIYPNNPENVNRIRSEQWDVENRLTSDCLRARGQPGLGGVEPIRRS
jgi:hypothetical protein